MVFLFLFTSIFHSLSSSIVEGVISHRFISDSAVNPELWEEIQGDFFLFLLKSLY